jgi:hypothetical protein
MTYAEAVAGGWYLDDGTGNSHLTPTGYRAAAARYLDALLAPLAAARNPDGYLMADVRQVNGLDADPSAVYTQSVEGNTIRVSDR